jgi:hypothetical protein
MGEAVGDGMLAKAIAFIEGAAAHHVRRGLVQARRRGCGRSADCRATVPVAHGVVYVGSGDATISNYSRSIRLTLNDRA